MSDRHEDTAKQIVDMVALDGEGADVRLVRKITAALQGVEDFFLTPRHISEWSEDLGPALWWTNPITEAPYVGSPLDCMASVTIELAEGVDLKIKNAVGTGWPGYHSWWTALPTNDQVGLIQSRIEAAIKAREAKS